MPNMFIVVGVTLAVLLVGGAAGYWIWLKTRPVKQVWSAFIYRLSQGVRPPFKTRKGEIISNLKLHDLRPYGRDIVERVFRGKGKTEIFRLQKLKKTVPDVPGDCVEFWGERQKIVHVLYHKGACTILRKGYHKKLGEIVFDPLPHNMVNMIKSEIIERESRFAKEKDILTALTPWVMAGILMLGMVAIAYAMMTGYIEIADKMQKSIDSGPAKPAVVAPAAQQAITPAPNILGAQTANPG